MSRAGPVPELTETAVRFARALRARGVGCAPAAAVDAVRALDAVDLGDRSEVYLALRTVLTSRPEDFAIFDELFGRFWSADGAPDRSDAEAPPPPPDRRIPAPAVERRPMLSLQNWMRPEAAAGEAADVPFASGDERLAETDFRGFNAEELEQITRVAARLARRLANRRSRRWRPARRGARVDARRTTRRSLRNGGELVELAFRERKRRKSRLVVICDVSGSMDIYSRFLLQFLFALQSAFARVETFIFSTRLRRITASLTGDSYAAALGELTRTAREWSGGTRIGASLAAFEAEWSHLLDRRTILVILSDGWDTGDPEQLDQAMYDLHRRAGKTIWLNPLLGSPGYQPLARGMQAALPHVDVFAPSHNLASLQALERHLVL